MIGRLFEANFHRNKHRSCLDYFNEKRLKRNLIKKKQTNILAKTKQNKAKKKPKGSMIID
jgi:hypothetical protein